MSSAITITQAWVTSGTVTLHTCGNERDPNMHTCRRAMQLSCCLLRPRRSEQIRLHEEASSVIGGGALCVPSTAPEDPLARRRTRRYF